MLLLQALQYPENAGVDTIRKDVAAMEAGLKRLEQQDQKYAAELDHALVEYAELKEQAVEFDTDELTDGRTACHPPCQRTVCGFPCADCLW